MSLWNLTVWTMLSFLKYPVGFWSATISGFLPTPWTLPLSSLWSPVLCTFLTCNCCSEFIPRLSSYSLWVISSIRITSLPIKCQWFPYLYLQISLFAGVPNSLIKMAYKTYQLRYIAGTKTSTCPELNSSSVFQPQQITPNTLSLCFLFIII